MVAALFVEKGGVYYGLPDVDPWPEERDARLYPGPHPVVAHPPCERWGNYWFGSPSGEQRHALGDDGGCFALAMRAVFDYGGVLEHPAGSRAWRTYGLPEPPRDGGWVSTMTAGCWTCCVDQGHYGHEAPKATWLMASRIRELPSLKWGAAPGSRPLEHLSHRQRRATPPEFAALLVSIARSARLPTPAPTEEPAK